MHVNANAIQLGYLKEGEMDITGILLPREKKMNFSLLDYKSGASLLLLIVFPYISKIGNFEK